MGDGSPHATRITLMALPLAAIAALVYIAVRGPEPAPGAKLPPAGGGEAAAPQPEVAAVEPEAMAPEPAPEAAVAPEVAGEAPSFDLVRVEPDGSAAVVGTAAPGAKVTIYADKAPLAEAEADAEGNFVAMFDVAPSAEPRALTLDATPPGGGAAATSSDVVMLLPRAPAVPAAEAVPGADAVLPAAETAAGPEATEAAEATEGTEPAAEVAAAQPEAEPAGEVAATAILRDDGVEVPPPPGDPAAARQLTLASISYTKAGEVTLAGVGTAGSTLRAYVDDRFAQDAEVAPDGRWSMDLGDVAQGLYQLRIDQLAGDGKVASRVETPFQRSYPEAPRARPGQGPAAPGVTVQPGNNLWTLARERYGSGAMYTQIFTANREQIRDPDLIYPGQIFVMPEQAVE